MSRLCSRAMRSLHRAEYYTIQYVDYLLPRQLEADAQSTALYSRYGFEQFNPKYVPSPLCFVFAVNGEEAGAIDDASAG